MKFHGLKFEDVVIRNSFQIKWIGFDKLIDLITRFYQRDDYATFSWDLIPEGCSFYKPDREILGAPE
jgi:hypothetical protein